MLKETRQRVVIVLFDFLIALFAFWLSRYFGDMPRWYWLVLSSFVWVLVGVLSGKLQFGAYKRLRYAYLGIGIINVVIGGSIYAYYSLILDYRYDYTILLVASIITILEWLLYHSVRLFVYRKIPFYYESSPVDKLCELGVKKVLKQQCLVQDENIDTIFNIIFNKKKSTDVLSSLKRYCCDHLESCIINESIEPEAVISQKVKLPKFIVHLCSLNNVRHMNTLFSYSNYCLNNGGFLLCHCETITTRKELIMIQSPVVVRNVICFFDYCWNRVFSKLSLTKRLYFSLTKGKRRALPRVEVLGKLYRAGFEILREVYVNGVLYVVAAKIKEPIRDDKPSCGALIRLRRVGKNGKIIGVYKFRTMYAYSEYLQSYVYQQEGLSKGGKFTDDYRITPVGKFMRKFWIDELPMFINWIKGDMKLIGVRPLSNHYFSLYSKELQKLRTKVKPGLLPPFYADMPETLEEIEESELRYLQAYLESPLKTDITYFVKCVKNIVFKGRRSK